MNKIGDKLLLTGDNFMPEMHLKLPQFAYSACAPFTKKNEIIQKFIQAGNTNDIHGNDLDKGYLQHDMAYVKYKGLIKIIQPENALRKRFNPKYDGYETRLASTVYKFFDKKSEGSAIKSTSNQQLADELHKQIIRNSKAAKSILILKTIFGELILLVCNYNKGIKFLLCVVDIFSKYAWAVPLKDKKLQLLLIHFKVFQAVQKENQIEYELFKSVNSITILLKMLR